MLSSLHLVAVVRPVSRFSILLAHTMLDMVLETDGNAEETIRLLICDDHRVLTDALKTVIRMQPGMSLVADPVTEPFAAVDIAATETPDVVLMDVDLNSEIDGIEATRRIKKVSPASRVVIMTASEERSLLVDAVEAGASGFLPKDVPVSEVIEAIVFAADGESLIDPVLLAEVLREVAKERAERREADLLLGQLTERECEILQMLARGRSNPEIAAELVISPQTVQTHVRNILAKLGLHSKLEAVAFAARNGLVSI